MSEGFGEILAVEVELVEAVAVTEEDAEVFDVVAATEAVLESAADELFARDVSSSKNSLLASRVVEILKGSELFEFLRGELLDEFC